MPGIRLYLAQRVSAMIMVPLVLLHLGIMIYAIHNGLSAAEILSRTQGSLFWGLVYGLFVIAVSVHAAIGLRAIAHEWFHLSITQLNWLASFVALCLLGLGGHAVASVVLL